MNPSRRRRTVVAACVAWPALAHKAFAAPDAVERPFVVGTSTPGGGFALYGEAVQRVLAAVDPALAMRVRATNGTVENLALLRSGAADGVDAALIQGTAASELFERPDADGLRILYAMYPSPGLLAVPADSPIARLEDALGRRIVFGVRTSGLVTLGRQVYGALGHDIDRDIDALYVDAAAESPRLVLAGRADGLWGAGEGWPGFDALARAPGGARFIGPSAEQIATIVARYPTLQPMTVAAGAYPGIGQPLPTVGSVNLILARADLDPARAARFVAAMERGHAALSAALPQAAFGTLAHTIAVAPAPWCLHAAVRRVAAGSAGDQR